jgi:hypothetical protein
MLSRATFVATATLAIGAAVAGIGFAAPVHADSGDDQFVAALNAHGVPGDRGAEIGIAHKTCDLRDLPRIAWGMEPPFSAAMRKVRGELPAQGVMPGAQMLAFKNATRDAYCPDLDQQIPKLP